MADIGQSSRTKADGASRFRIPGGGVAAGLACGLLGGAGLGALYAHLGAWLPVYYLPAPLFLGWGVGAACGLGSRLGGRLTPRVGRLLGALAGAAAMYVSWVFWILALSSYEVLAASPAAMYGVIAELAEKGVWTLRGWTPKGGQLLLIWSVEFAVVVLIAAGTTAMYCQEREREVEKERSRVF